MEEGKGHPIYCRKYNPEHLRDIHKNDNLKEEILLNVNDFKNDTLHVKSVRTSPSNKYLSYSIDKKGNEKYDIVIKEYDTNKEIYTIKNILYGSYTWGINSKYIFYIESNVNGVMNKLNVLNIETKQTRILYEEVDMEYGVSFYTSDNNKYYFVDISSSDTNEVYYIDVNDIEFKMFLVRKREKGIKYMVEDYDKHNFITLSNHKYVNFNMYMLRKNNLPIFQEIMDYNDNIFLEGISNFENYIVLSGRINGYQRVIVIEKKNIIYGKYDIIEIDEKISTITMTHHNQNYETSKLILSYESLTKPYSLIEYDFNTKNKKVLFQKVIPNYDSNNYISKQINVKSHDNVNIPVSMVYSKDIDITQENPLIQIGYGAYGINYDVELYRDMMTLVDYGFIFCISHIRGGSDKGYQWYLDGKMENKINSFKDFISISEFLIKNKFTTPNKLVIEGRSAGGLLMGAVMTMRPDLYQTVHLGVPFVDVLCTMRDSNIPLTTGEWNEWGNPNYKEYYDIIKEYSPIDNIKKTNYPNTLITSGLHDPRVQYYEPTKFQMKLKEYMKDNNIHLLKTDMDKGHFSNTNRYSALQERAYEFSFFIKTLKLKE